jgi:toxin FitB
MYLCDTNVLSELARPQPDANVLAWLAKVDRLILSAITVEELYFGLSWHPNPRIARWLEALLADSTVLPVTSEVARLGGELRGKLMASGRPRTQADLLIAAAARHHDLVLVTRNLRDFSDCGISLFDPFVARA